MSHFQNEREEKGEANNRGVDPRNEVRAHIGKASAVTPDCFDCVLTCRAAAASDGARPARKCTRAHMCASACACASACVRVCAMNT
eukprot:743367-Pleurochrysis_carterae.AAC.1